jgi:hypothetical protein
MIRPLLSSFSLDQVRLALSLLPYNLGNLWRRQLAARAGEETAGRLVEHAPYYWPWMVEDI